MARILHVYIPKQFVVIVSALIVMATIVLVIVKCVPSGPRSFSYEGPEPPVRAVTMSSNEGEYEVAALEGQIEVIFNQNVSHEQVIRIFKEYNVRILAQFPKSHYYMIEVPAGRESEYILQLSRIPEISYVQPNVLYTLCSASPYVIDDFYDDHGDMVSEMMKKAAEGKIPQTYNAGNPNKKDMISGKIKASIEDIFEQSSRNGHIVINLSTGVGLYDIWKYLWLWERERRLWNYSLVSSWNKNDYKMAFKNQLTAYISYVRPYHERDFVIVKAAGNEGMKEMNTIIADFRLTLDSLDKVIFDKHFILVTAKDDNKEGDYPNDVSHYIPEVTKVDISDKTAESLHWQGTSFASPRVAGFITRAANEYDMNVVDVLQCVRRATRKASGNVLTYSLIAEEIEKERREASYAYKSEDILADLVGKTIYIPSDDEYLASIGYWHLDLDEIVDVSILNNSEKNGIVETNAMVYLRKGELRVDAEMLLLYQKTKNGMSLESWMVNKMTIPPQQDYSQFVKLQYATDFIPGLEAYNYSDVSLFVVIDYVSNGENSRYVGIIEPLSSAFVTIMGYPESYSVRFAYKF